MSWLNSYFKNIRMAVASAGHYPSACDCDIYEEWVSGIEYKAGTIVVYQDIISGKKFLYYALGIIENDHHNDAFLDEPSKSRHWQLICSCDEIETTPTPSDFVYATPTPTPTLEDCCETPTPVDLFDCADIEVWDENKIVESGLPHYIYKSIIQWQGRVYEARDYEGTEKNDIPGISNHWTFLYNCPECVCIPRSLDKITITGFQTLFGIGSAEGFIQGSVIGYNINDFTPGNGVRIRLNNPEKENAFSVFYLENLQLNSDETIIYYENQYTCYKAVILKSEIDTIFDFEFAPHYENCPTPSPTLNCGYGFQNVFHTTGKSGSNEPVDGLSAELFDDGGKLYFHDIKVSELDSPFVFASCVFKNDSSGLPFGIILVTGKFVQGDEEIIYEEPNGKCWKGTVLPNGQNIILHLIN